MSHGQVIVFHSFSKTEEGVKLEIQVVKSQEEYILHFSHTIFHFNILKENFK